jgi:hypothetical protein
MLQFYDVAGPGVALQHLHGALGDFVGAFAHFPCELVQEPLDQQRDVFITFSQRGHCNRKHLQPVPQVDLYSNFLLTIIFVFCIKQIEYILFFKKYKFQNIGYRLINPPGWNRRTCLGLISSCISHQILFGLFFRAD